MANALGELFGDIASAIREKTGDAQKMKPAQFPEKISEIETGVDVSGVTATAPHVLAGDVFVDADGNPVNGTMKNNGAVLKKLRYSGYDEKYTYTIPEGYHDGTGIVEVRCDSEQIVYPSKYRQRLYGTPIRDNDWNLTGYNFLGHVVIDPIPDQYQDVTPVTATAEDVRAGKVFVDAEGNAVEGALSGTIADVSGVTATAANVLQGKTIVDADGNEVEGSIPVVETSEVELSVQTPSGAIPVGYYANGVALSVAAKSAAVTPTKETQNLADSFYDSITVDPIPEEYQNVSGVTATAEDVVEGKVIVDAQGNEVVGTLVPGGGGGGSLPAGLYWQDARPDMPHPTNFNHKLFEFNGDVYAIANTSSSGKAKNVCKLANGAWTTILSYTFDIAYTPFKCLECNGKMHLIASNYHYSFDGSTVKKYANVREAIGGYPLDGGYFVEDGKLKVASNGTKAIHVWNEATDTWTKEWDMSVLTSSTSHSFYNYNDKVYVVAYASGYQLYEYNNGVLTFISKLANTVWKVVFHKNHLYNISDGGYVYKFSLEDKTETFIGYVPRVYGYTGNMQNYCDVLGGQIHLYSGGYSSSFYASNLIMHEVTE